MMVSDREGQRGGGGLGGRASEASGSKPGFERGAPPRAAPPLPRPALPRLGTKSAARAALEGPGRTGSAAAVGFGGGRTGGLIGRGPGGAAMLGVLGVRGEARDVEPLPLGLGAGRAVLMAGGRKSALGPRGAFDGGPFWLLAPLPLPLFLGPREPFDGRTGGSPGGGGLGTLLLRPLALLDGPSMRGRL